MAAAHAEFIDRRESRQPVQRPQRFAPVEHRPQIQIRIAAHECRGHGRVKDRNRVIAFAAGRQGGAGLPFRRRRRPGCQMRRMHVPPRVQPPGRIAQARRQIAGANRARAAIGIGLHMRDLRRRQLAKQRQRVTGGVPGPGLGAIGQKEPRLNGETHHRAPGPAIGDHLAIQFVVFRQGFHACPFFRQAEPRNRETTQPGCRDTKSAPGKPGRSHKPTPETGRRNNLCINFIESI